MVRDFMFRCMLNLIFEKTMRNVELYKVRAMPNMKSRPKTYLCAHSGYLTEYRCCLAGTRVNQRVCVHNRHFNKIHLKMNIQYPTKLFSTNKPTTKHFHQHILKYPKTIQPTNHLSVRQIDWSKIFNKGKRFYLSTTGELRHTMSCW